MKKIMALQKRVFEENFDNDKFRYFDYACFISILDEDNDEMKYDTSIDNFLQVRMWDIEHDILSNTGETLYRKPSNGEIKKIVEFVNRHKDKCAFIIHCSAGVSRSGAVARFILDKFRDEVDISSFNEDNGHIQPNLYILKRLKEFDKIYLKNK